MILIIMKIEHNMESHGIACNIELIVHWIKRELYAIQYLSYVLMFNV